MVDGIVAFQRTVDDLLRHADTVTLTDGSYFIGGTRVANVLRNLFEEFAGAFLLCFLGQNRVNTFMGTGVYYMNDAPRIHS